MNWRRNFNEGWMKEPVKEKVKKEKNEEKIKTKTRKEEKKENEADMSERPHDSVRKRVHEWEREKERLREMERLEAFERVRDEELELEFARKVSEQDLSSFSTCSLPEDQEQSIQFAKVAVRASAQVVATSPSFLGLSFCFCVLGLGADSPFLE